MLERINGDFLVGSRVTLADGSKFLVPATVSVGADGSTVDLSALQAAIGSPTDAPWNGTDPSATLISIAKSISLNTATT